MIQSSNGESTILILMSTYNGEKFLNEQLESLSNQKDITLDILVRDDGSTDNTVNILQKWEKRLNLSWYKGDNLKPAKSFMDLVFHSGKYDYYAFCDQDDIWDNDKLKVAINLIKEKNCDREVLYGSSTRVVDEKLNLLYESNVTRAYSLGESFLRNNIAGCTMVFNQKLMTTLKKHMPIYIEMHDSWIYKVCQVVGGEFILDRTPHISYRQHGNNVLGTTNNYFVKIKHRLHKMIFKKNNISLTANELLIGYQEIMSLEKNDMLNLVKNYNLSLFNKINLIKSPYMKTGNFTQKTFFVIEVLFNRL